MASPLINNPVLVSALAVCGLCGLLAVGVCRSHRLWCGAMKGFLAWPPLRKAVFILLGTIATALAQKSGANVVNGVDATNGVVNATGTNEVGNAAWTNGMDGAQGEVPPPLMMLGSFRPTEDPELSLVVLSPHDALRDYRLDFVTTNEAVSYDMPTNAATCGTWRLTGAYDDVVRVGLGEFRFPLGSDLCDHLWASVWGEVRPRLGPCSNGIAAVGAPMSAIPDVSRFWTATTSNGAYLLTWENFAAGRVPASATRDASGTVNAQIELKRNGDFVTRSNSVESVYRRVNPDDWDGDGWMNEVDAAPDVPGEEGFGPHQDYPGNQNTNHHYWVDVVVSNADALVEFVGDGPSELADPKFIAKVGETNRVYLLVGKWYDVHCDLPICCVDTEDEDVQVWGDGHDLVIWWPVYMDFVGRSPLLLAAPTLGSSPGGGGVSPNLLPPRVGGGAYGWENDFCCSSSAADGTPIFDCDGLCVCGGCYTGDITYTYSGYSLTFGGWSCGCVPHDDPRDPHPEEQGGASGPSVSAHFSKSAIIFEDAYENEPGVTVPRRSTDTEVEFYVYGGTNGGTYAFSIVNAGKLNRIGGGRLTKTGSIAAGKSFRYKVRYDALQASGSEDDIIAKAEFTEFGTGQRLSDETATLTAVKVELVVVANAPANECEHRHKYGVGELVSPILTPRVDASWIFSYDANVDDRGKLQCPIHAATNPFEIRYGGVSYSPSVNVIQPNGIKGINPFVETYGVPIGCAGGIGLGMQFRVLPVDVSFSQIAVEEVPSSAENHSGYFANPYFSGEWCHSRQTGAGRWADVDVNNIVGGHDGYFDLAALVTALPRMTSEGVITDDPTELWVEGYNVWTFPFGWNVQGTKGFSEPYACFASGTTQEFSIDRLGTAGVRKLGYSVRREIFGTIHLDTNGDLSDE